MRKKDKTALENIDNSYFVEGLFARNERTIKRLIVGWIATALAMVVVILALISVIIGHIKYEREHENVEESTIEESYEYEIEQEADDNSNLVGYAEGDVNIGTSAD